MTGAGWLGAVQRRTRILFNETLPSHVYAVMRLSVGIIYFWFGFLKFPFVPGGSPADPLIGAWGDFIKPHTFMIILAVVETTAGALLLLGIGVRVVSGVLLFHVLGTFATVVVGREQVFNLQYGLYSLTLAGQYILKNLLMFAAFFALATTSPRRHPRWPVITAARALVRGQELPAMTRNVSWTGASFFIPATSAPAPAVGEQVSLSVQAPLAAREVTVQGRVMHCARSNRDYWLIGCAVDDASPLMEALAPWFAEESRIRR